MKAPPMEKKPSNHFLKYLSAAEQEQFHTDLLDAIDRAKSANDFSIIDNFIEDWEDVAELNSIPGFKKRVWKKYNQLKEAGLVN